MRRVDMVVSARFACPRAKWYADVDTEAERCIARAHVALMSVLDQISIQRGALWR